MSRVVWRTWVIWHQLAPRRRDDSAVGTRLAGSGDCGGRDAEEPLEIERPSSALSPMEMTSRQFTDERGEVWHVWPVHPESLERRIADDPHLSRGVERRAKRESRVRVTNPEMAGGWLAFESRTERRRLGPIPESWVDMDEVALRSLLARATPADSSRRLLK